MKTIAHCVCVIIVLSLFTAQTAAQKQAPNKKPVPTFTDDDASVAPAYRSPASPGNATDSWTRSSSAWPALKSLRARITMDSPAGHVEAMFEAVQPNRFHMTANAIEFISIGDSIYVKAAGMGWQKQAVGSSSALSFKGILNNDFLKGGTPVFVDTEKIDGIDADVYDVTSATGQNDTVRVWIGKSDGLPRKLSGNINGMSMVVHFYDFNKDDISIKAPV